MAPERIAVVTIFVCIGILLLSACGLPLGPTPRAQPALLAGDFALYAGDGTLLAEGHLFDTGKLSLLRARLTLHAPACLHDRQFDLRGSLHPTLTLASPSGSNPRLLLHSDTAPIYAPYSVRVLPFRGHLTLSGSCADGDIAVEARLLPPTP